MARGPLRGDRLRGLLLVGVLAGEEAAGAPPGSRALGEQDGPEILRPKGVVVPRVGVASWGPVGEEAEAEEGKREVAEGRGTLELAQAPSTIRRRGSWLGAGAQRLRPGEVVLGGGGAPPEGSRGTEKEKEEEGEEEAQMASVGRVATPSAELRLCLGWPQGREKGNEECPPLSRLRTPHYCCHCKCWL